MKSRLDELIELLRKEERAIKINNGVVTVKPKKPAGKPRMGGLGYDTRSTISNETILQYVNDHMGESYSVTDMSKDLGMQFKTLAGRITRLKKKGLVPLDFNNYRNKNKSKAVVIEVTTQEPTRHEEGAWRSVARETLQPQEHNNEVIIMEVDRMAWEYIKLGKDENYNSLIGFVNYIKEKK
jgi:DNA-binding Lrp family transcriptional regulator